MKNVKICIAFALAFVVLFISSTSLAQVQYINQKAKVVFVEDGNSVFLQFQNQKDPYKAYLIAVDAPYEQTSCYWSESRNFLEKLVNK